MIFTVLGTEVAMSFSWCSLIQTWCWCASFCPFPLIRALITWHTIHLLLLIMPWRNLGQQDFSCPRRFKFFSIQCWPSRFQANGTVNLWSKWLLIAFPVNDTWWKRWHCCPETVANSPCPFSCHATRTKQSSKRAAKLRELVRIKNRIYSRVAVLKKFDGANGLPGWWNLWPYVRNQWKYEKRKPANHKEGDHEKYCLSNTNLHAKIPSELISDVYIAHTKRYQHNGLRYAHNK